MSETQATNDSPVAVDMEKIRSEMLRNSTMRELSKQNLRRNSMLHRAHASPPFARSQSYINILAAYLPFNEVREGAVTHHFLGGEYLMSAHSSEIGRLMRIRGQQSAAAHVHDEHCNH